MRIAFRVDSSKDIGTGHVMRCMALAERLVEHGHRVQFYCRNLPGNINQRIHGRGFEVTQLAAPAEYREVKSSSDYAGWLQVTEAQDAQEFIEKISLHDVELVIVDHYALASEWEDAVKPEVSIVVAIDDLVRKHSAQMVIDQTFSRTETEYLNADVKQVLAGSEYALLREEFNIAREKLVRGEVEQHRLLITMGGIDLNDSTSKIVAALSAQPLDWITDVQVILSENAPNFGRVRDLVKDLSDKFQLHTHIDNMSAFMSDATISIGAPGSTSWERACLGLPSVLVPLADNQKDVAKVFAQTGAAEIVDFESISTGLLTSLEKIRGDWQGYSQRSMVLCDGLGISRVIQYLFAPKARDNQKVYLKKATLEDMELVYNWQCEPETRRFARNKQVPSWPEHERWMRGKLKSKDCCFYIVYYGEHPSGVVRLDKMLDKEQGYEVSIFLSSDKKRLGLATIALQLVAELHKNVEIYATVFDENKASLALFLNSGYQNVANNLYKLIR